MKLNALPALMGLFWLKDALTLFKKHIQAYLALFALLAILSVVVQLLPLGVFLPLAVNAIGAITLMLLTHGLLHKDSGTKLSTVAQVFPTLFRHRPLMILALTYTLFLGATLILTTQIFIKLYPESYIKAIEYAAMLQTPEITSPELIAEAWRYNFSIQLLSFLPPLILLPFFCMTPALVFSGQVKPFKAILFNLIAFLRNWQTWLIFLILWSAIFALTTLLILALMFLLSNALGVQSGISLASMFAFILYFAISAILCSSLYFAYESSYLAS